MRTHLEFRSSAFPAYAGEDDEINPGRYGKRLAEFIAAKLPDSGYTVSGMNAEDWGWRIDLQNEAFPLWIGCGNYNEYADGFLCFLEPSRPFLRKWFKRVPTSGIVEPLAAALEQILRDSEMTDNLRWWDEADTGQR